MYEHDRRKSPWRLSPTRKANQRKRLKNVDNVISAIAESGVEIRSLGKALELPTEAEMRPKVVDCLLEEREICQNKICQNEIGAAGDP
ncbi:hypothetical protein I316_00341 [Kwoniella heveanensis BCC8398]|uniref:Uncharacterized protein n=1 Tax=Kwoniella heveanensis BCC8398 TaxID=1296120 RepID=A0A1B9H4C1_9TREE|nr:hypothetical protein I316_00341 [Kwoniella heveanensis BCC8398]